MEMEARFNAKLDLALNMLDEQLKRMDEERKQWKNGPLMAFAGRKMEVTQEEESLPPMALSEPAMAEGVPPLAILDVVNSIVDYVVAATNSDVVEVHDAASTETASLPCGKIRAARSCHAAEPPGREVREYLCLGAHPRHLRHPRSSTHLAAPDPRRHHQNHITGSRSVPLVTTSALRRHRRRVPSTCGCRHLIDGRHRHPKQPVPCRHPDLLRRLCLSRGRLRLLQIHPPTSNMFH
ncbi:hypothetical protein GUJ93_ZPchr0013g35503 [Zizania palustris]|uniref:Uncharacterized protein n=1 Tax=Zizania palustris TaxID=103762 RepID=A0A8J6C241_ZIZPA|nr:hypothetical protein GUJ93_ZPchr0013g35503 [Zizania palustris]